MFLCIFPEINLRRIERTALQLVGSGKIKRIDITGLHQLALQLVGSEAHFKLPQLTTLFIPISMLVLRKFFSAQLIRQQN